MSISQETRQRVLSAAGELNYQPHRFARALRGKGTRLLGLIVREIDDPFFCFTDSVISSVANEQGFQVVLGYANSDPAEALALSEIPDFRHTDGLLLLGDLRELPGDYTSWLRLRRTGGLCPSVEEAKRLWAGYLLLQLTTASGHAWRLSTCINWGTRGSPRYMPAVRGT